MIMNGAAQNRAQRRHPIASDVEHITWAAERLGIGVSTAYRLAIAGQLPGAFKVGAQWRVSVPRFLHEVHGPAESGDPVRERRSDVLGGDGPEAA